MTILTALSNFAAEQSKPMEKTLKRLEQLLDYMHTNPSAGIRFQALDMILNVHSNASYLSAAGWTAIDICFLEAYQEMANQSFSTETFKLHVLS